MPSVTVPPPLPPSFSDTYTVQALSGLPFGSTNAIAFSSLSDASAFFFSSAAFPFSLKTRFFGFALGFAAVLRLEVGFFFAGAFFLVAVVVRFLVVLVAFLAGVFRVFVAVLVAKPRTERDVFEVN
jgi:hypothetical protein